MDQGAQPGEHFASPIAQLLDPPIDQFGRIGRWFLRSAFLHLPVSKKFQSGFASTLS
jgi:hypothetical protein